MMSVAAYVTRSSDRDVLIDSMDSARTQLDDTRRAVTDAAHDFTLLRRSFEDHLTQDIKTVLDVYVALQQQVPLIQQVQTTVKIDSMFNEIETAISEPGIRLEELKMNT